MKLTLLLLAVFAACAVSAVPLTDEIPERPYQRYIPYIDSDGVDKVIDLEEQPDEQLLAEIRSDPSKDSVYTLFTRKNPSAGQVLTNAASFHASYYNPRVETVVVAHGWLSNEESGINTAIRSAFLDRKDCNVIILEWKKLARSNYVTAVRGVPDVGRGLGNFIKSLTSNTGAKVESFHLVGFSLGAHLVGNAGRQLGGRVARISALDPAGPLWNLNSNKVKSSDAIYVEGIHTDGELEASLGIGYSIGDVDFFPNGGNSQPGCISHTCSHNRAWRFFASSVTYDHLQGRGCSNRVQLYLNTCRGAKLNMGNSQLRKNGSGLFLVKTGRRYPY